MIVDAAAAAFSAGLWSILAAAAAAIHVISPTFQFLDIKTKSTQRPVRPLIMSNHLKMDKRRLRT